MQYRRSTQAGACYFFTVNLADRRQDLLVRHIDLLRAAFTKVKRRYPFHIDAAVVLPDHLHTLWTLPEGDADFAKRWRLIKVAFSRELPQDEQISASRRYKGERGIWQRRYWEHLIRDEQDFRNHLDYIHFNPVKHGWVNRCTDWPYSSFHRYVANGFLSEDWGVEESFDQGLCFGE
ncbi:REP-associated tyrosine transposase [Marinobacterium jannaschii]|uniref:REP-associated tyrosine transposase n=1 Tax=Marinobacterium jannaschii TaxID=64970 RepID=UPI0004810D1B|nr:transposase [Marinobacterium jannaschii]